MKKVLFILGIILTMPIIASAHTTLTSSSPSEGETITEELKELKVEFAGEIENQSTLTLVKDQQDINFDSITVGDKQVVGTLSEPLGDGNYTLTWKIASTDGHVISGDISFKVDLPAEETEAITPKESGQASDTQENNTSTAEENTNVDTETEEVNDNSSMISTISIIVLVILLVVGVWILLRKKR
ncbi:copper resistance CopC family protein [uncultured Metabacillus sp.]|uniref:copper resistance CopC family protein n=1 Tax=uncultured Metabacillus sp. TaxID=2860135 RepID=UPI002620C705|nr:copper resistance CopC family protein [uncultured Metabacillus sp.]